MRLIDHLLGRHTVLDATYNGSSLFSMHQTFRDGEESLPSDFRDYVEGGYQSNGVVFGCILARMLLLSEVEFKWRNLSDRTMYGDQTLRRLELPWPNGDTGELVARAEQDVSLAGNFYVRRAGSGLERLRPDWVSIVSAVSETSGRREVVGYTFDRDGKAENRETYTVDQVAHWSPIPDPLASFRGMSWLTPVVREIAADTRMSKHKLKFFENAATPNMVVTLNEFLEADQKQEFLDSLNARHQGVGNAYKTMVVDGGADVTVVGNSFEQMSFATVQAAGENRIAVASGVPAIVVGLKEGLQAATYSNYGQAMRRFADLTVRPLWRSLSASLETVVDVPSGTRLWYDDRHIPALQQDAMDAAEIFKSKASTVRALTDGGFTPESAMKAVENEDLTVLEHTGLFSVQLQEAGQDTSPAPERSVRKVERDADGRIVRVVDEAS